MFHVTGVFSRGKMCLIAMLCAVFLTALPLRLAADGLEQRPVIVVFHDAMIGHSNKPASMQLWRVVQDPEQDRGAPRGVEPCHWKTLLSLLSPCRAFHG